MGTHTGWLASLSNGETVFQAPDVEGEPSCWRKLLNRCEAEGIHITQIQLQVSGMTVVAMNNAHGYCAVYEAHRSFGRSPGTESSKLPIDMQYQGVGAVFGDFVFLVFTHVNRTIWTDVRPLEQMRVHCQLKPAQARMRKDNVPRLTENVLAELPDPGEDVADIVSLT